MKNYSRLLWEDLKSFLILNESGQSFARVDANTPKTYGGELTRATKKIDISGGKREIITSHIRDLVLEINKFTKFWKPDNPYIKNGYIFNGSSQHLMNPDIDRVLQKVADDPNISLERIKAKYGDVDVIVPKQKLDVLKSFLDTKDDNKPEWEPNSGNKITDNFHYVGRTRGGESLGQIFTLFWYKPNSQIVQVDFEGDEMVTDEQGFEKPSEWTKFSKASPLDDLAKGIKGMAGAILLRSLARGTTQLKNAIVLTTGGAKKFREGKPLSDKDISKNKRDSIPAEFTLNSGGGGEGIRRAYKFVGEVNGKKAYEFLESRVGRSMGGEFAPITNLSEIFKTLFKRTPSSEDLANFRSFQGLLRMVKKNLDSSTIKVVMDRFAEILSEEPISSEERKAILDAISSIL